MQSMRVLCDLVLVSDFQRLTIRVTVTAEQHRGRTYSSRYAILSGDEVLFRAIGPHGLTLESDAATAALDAAHRWIDRNCGVDTASRERIEVTVA
jgi:hypothetical protein